MKKYSKIKLCIVFLLVLWIIKNHWINKMNGKTIISLVEVIERYKKIKGHYPSSIEELAPQYLVKPPSLQDGLFWNVETPLYYIKDTGHYRLSYSLPAGLSQSYDSRTQQWNIRD